MTGKGDDTDDRELSEQPNKDGVRGQDSGADTTRDGLTRQDWEQLPSDPRSADDLGYTLCEWEEFATLADSQTVMFLPADEEVLKEDAFVVVAKDLMVDLENRY